MCPCVSSKVTKGVDSFGALDLTVVCAYGLRIIMRLWVWIHLCHIGVQSWDDWQNVVVSVLDRHLKEPIKCLWRWVPDCRTTFFRPPAHLCAVTNITELLLNVTLSYQFNQSTNNMTHWKIMFFCSLHYSIPSVLKPLIDLLSLFDYYLS